MGKAGGEAGIDRVISMTIYFVVYMYKILKTKEKF